MTIELLTWCIRCSEGFEKVYLLGVYQDRNQFLWMFSVDNRCTWDDCNVVDEWCYSNWLQCWLLFGRAMSSGGPWNCPVTQRRMDRQTDGQADG